MKTITKTFFNRHTHSIVRDSHGCVGRGFNPAKRRIESNSYLLRCFTRAMSSPFSRHSTLVTRHLSHWSEEKTKGGEKALTAVASAEEVNRYRRELTRHLSTCVFNDLIFSNRYKQQLCKMPFTLQLIPASIPEFAGHIFGGPAVFCRGAMVVEPLNLGLPSLAIQMPELMSLK
jgi:hypothetical protein